MVTAMAFVGDEPPHSTLMPYETSPQALAADEPGAPRQPGPHGDWKCFTTHVDDSGSGHEPVRDRVSAASVWNGVHRNVLVNGGSSLTFQDRGTELKPAEVDVHGAQPLTLVVGDSGNVHEEDHADRAIARTAPPG